MWSAGSTPWSSRSSLQRRNRRLRREVNKVKSAIDSRTGTRGMSDEERRGCRGVGGGGGNKTI